MVSTLDELAEHAQEHDFSAEMQHAVWETDTEVDPMVTTSLRLPESLLDWVRQQAASQHVRPSALIRRWVEEHRESDEHRGSGAEDVASRLERLERAVFPDARAS